MRGEYEARRHFPIAVGLGLLVVAQGASAQSTPGSLDRDAQRIQDNQAQQARERAQQFDARQQRPPSGTQPELGTTPQGTDSEGCAAIHAVIIAGMTRYSEGDFAAELAQLKGDCINVGAINTALRAITNRYVADGFVTSRAFVGPQNLKDGNLTITVIEGSISGVKGKGTKPYHPQELAAAFPAHKGDTLNLRALEQGVDQLARLAGGDPSIDVAPGDAPGSSAVLVQRKPQAPWLRPALAINNDGAASTGRLTGTATLDADSLLGLADLWSLYYSQNLGNNPTQGNHAWGGFVSLPHGWWTLSLSGGGSDYHSVLTGNGLSFVSNGKSWNAGATLNRLMHRDAHTKLSLSLGLALLDTSNFIQGIRLRTGSYRIVSARMDTHWQHRSGASLISVNLGFVRGLGILGAYAANTGPGGPTSRFSLISGDAAWQSRFAVGSTRFTNAVTLRGQWGFDNIFPAERFSLGGTSTVRGFRDDGISGRTGFAFREQLGFGIVDLARTDPRLATTISGFLAYDLGGIRPNAYSSYEHGLMQSGTIGVRAQNRHVQADLALSLPITAPSWVGHKGSEIYASLRIVL